MLTLPLGRYRHSDHIKALELDETSPRCQVLAVSDPPDLYSKRRLRSRSRPGCVQPPSSMVSDRLSWPEWLLQRSEIPLRLAFILDDEIGWEFQQPE